jgi:competence protein ComEC
VNADAEGRGHDLRLVPAAAAAWLAAAVGVSLSGGRAVALAGLLGAVAVAAVATAWLMSRSLVRAGGDSSAARGWSSAQQLLRRPGPLHLLAAAACCAAGGAGAAALRVVALERPPLPALAAQRATAQVRLTITGDPRLLPAQASGPALRPPLVLVPARASRLVSRGSTVSLRAPLLVLTTDRDWLTLLPSQQVTTSGRLGPPRPGDANAAVLSAHGPPREVTAPSTVQGAAGRLRAGLREAVTPLPPAERGLLPGLVLGDVTAMPPELVEDFRTTGLTHLTAVSGANVGIVILATLWAARWAGLRGLALPVVAAAAMAGFVVLCRPQPSVLRASVMGAVALVALATGRRRQGVPALAAAVVALVLVDPWLSRSYGFVLSVLATGGILLLAPGWRDAWSRRLPRPFAEALAIPVAAQVACAPVIVLLAAQVSLVAVPANLLVAPAVPPATVLGVLAAASAPVAPPLAGALGRLGGVPAGWIADVATVGARAPAAAFPWPQSTVGAAALVGLLLAGRLLVGRRWPRRLALAALVGGCAILIGGRVFAPPAWPPPGWVLVACDVGQGDALVLSAGPGAAVVVDAGPEPEAVDRCLRALGVRQVPLVLLTHLHADHVEGLPGVLRGRAVGEVQVGPLDEPAEESTRVLGWARAAGVPVTRARVGEVRRAGALRWTVIWPTHVLAGDASQPNDASVVIMAEHGGVRMLLTGDVEPAAQRALLRLGGDLRADVLKVPHHGSAHQEDRMLTAVRARVAVMSVGADNSYGHPSPATLDELAATGARVLRTDLDGDVAVVGPGDELRVVSRSTAGRVSGP